MTQASARMFFVFALELQGSAEAVGALASSNTFALGQLNVTEPILDRTGMREFFKHLRDEA